MASKKAAADGQQLLSPALRAGRYRKGILMMFGLVPFVSDSSVSNDENVFDRLMNVFDEDRKSVV